MALNLTDDELLAVASSLKIVWPFELLTVAVDDLVAASLRGVRSLVARELAQVSDGNVKVDKSASDLISAMPSGDEYFVSYVGANSRPLALAGTSTYLWGEGQVVVDMVTAGGIHSLRSTDRSNGIELLVATVENVFRLGLREPSVGFDAASLYSLSSRDSGRTVLRAFKGSIQLGRFELEDNPVGASFTVDETWTSFDHSQVSAFYSA